MAVSDGQRKDTMALEICQYLFIFNFLNFVTSSIATLESHGQAFIQTDNELRYMVDGVPLHVVPGQDLDSNSISNVQFDPPMLDFEQQPVGMPRMEQVTVHNPHSHNSVHLLSISGNTLHFHCSFFKVKIVPPGGNTTFDVVFLARQVGNVENTLFIHTSRGSFRYQVFGVGVPNPYRIRPFLGAKVPINSSFSPLINMHNPHSSTLQIREMYSSGGDLHLELPTGEKEAHKNLWEIPPYETKPVMRASFMARVEMNHTAFIRIKTNRERKDEVLVLPVEVEVSSAPGLYITTEMLDFGILRTFDGPKTLRLNVLNSKTDPVHITSISTSSPNDAISIDFRPTKIPPDILNPTTVAHISFTASKAIHPQQWSGKIIMKSKSGNYKLSVPYQASVLHGSLVYDSNYTKFYIGKPPYVNITHSLPLTNTFNFTVAIYNVSFPPDVQKYFSIINFTHPTFIQPQQTLTAFRFQFRPSSPHNHFSTQLRLYTNASTFYIPVNVFNGKLKVIHHRPEIYKGQLDFGTMGMGEHRSMTFTLRNENPVDIIIREFGANMDKTSVELLGVEKGNDTTLTRQHNTSDIDTNPLVLKPYHFAVFNVNLIAPDFEGTFAAEVILVTQYENLYIPMTLRTAEGSLNAIPEKLVFDKVFPGKMPFKILKMHSSFENYMEVREISFRPNDTRFFVKQLPSHIQVLLEPQRDSVIGKIYFDAKRECKDDCYVGLPTHIPEGHQWLLGLGLDKDVADTDQYLHTRFQQKWDIQGVRESSTINVTIQVDTNHVRGFLFPAQAHLHWPSLARKCKIKFPLTQIGNLSVSDFVVENPGDMPVIVQLLPLSLYPSPQKIVDVFSKKLTSELTDFIETDDLDVFTLQDLEEYNTKPSNPVAGYRKTVQDTLGVKPHKKTITTILNPGGKMRIHIGFQPRDEISRTSLIVIRNNLTILDTVVVQGEGARGEMRFSNRKPSSPTPLLFEMQEKHLKNCDKKKQTKSIPPNFTVKRTFTARNTGELPFYVHGFYINDVRCEGYGFKILDCRGFELHPNTSRKIDIAFTPDFTMSRIRRTLSLFTSLGPPMNYTLQATIPSHMLTRCSSALPRPSWEPILFYIVVGMMVFLLFCILIASYFEADRIFTTDIRQKYRQRMISAAQTFDKSKIFDLKTIAGVKPNDAKPKTPPEIANGHLEVRKKKEISQVTVSSNHAAKSNSRMNSHENNNSKSQFDRQNSREKEVKSGSTSSSGKNSSADKGPSIASLTNLETLDKANIVQKLNVKKYKAAKRTSGEITESNVSSVDNRKSSNNTAFSNKDSNTTNTGSNSKKSNSTDDRTDKISTQNDKSKPASSKSDSKVTSLLTELRDSSPPISVTNDDVDEIPTESTTKKEGKKSRRTKSKAVLKRLEKDRRMKERQRRLENPENDNDETSSTTTESSSLEADDKNSSARESTPEPLPSKAKKLKGKPKAKDKKKSEADEEANDEQFVLHTKSKAHKKIKSDRASFGSSSIDSINLELPYTTKLEAAKESEMKAGSIGSKALKKNAKLLSHAAKNSLKGLDIEPPRVASKAYVSSSWPDTDSSDSPPPVWDLPKPVSTTDDLSELSAQTEQFMYLHGGTKHPLGLLGSASAAASLAEPLSSSCSSSYSSIVSSNSDQNSSNGNNGRKKAGNEPRKSAFSAVPDPTSQNVGAIGTKSATPRQSPTLPGLRNNPWAVPTSSPTPSMQSSNYGLHPIEETRMVPPRPDDDMEMYARNQAYQAMPEVNGQYGGFNNLYEPPVSMMKRLQAERRKRLQEYQNKLLKGEDWPGFNIAPMPSDSLWDNNAVVSDAWTPGATVAPPRPVGAGGVWDNSLPSTNKTWNSVRSIWNSESVSNPATVTMETNSLEHAKPDKSNPGNALGGFDPFALRSIWNPATVTGNSSPWGPLPKPDLDEE